MCRGTVPTIAIPTIIMGGNAIPYFTLLKYPVLGAGIRYSKQSDVIDELMTYEQD